MLLLINNLIAKPITQSQDGRNFGSARAICNLHLCYLFAIVLHICNSVTYLHSCYLFAIVLHEKCTRFQPVKRARFSHV